MKYLYIVLALALIAGGYLLIAPQFQENTTPLPAEVPEMQMEMEALEAGQETQTQPQAQETEDAAAVDQNAEVIEVRGTNFAFDVKEIRVQKGDTVTINFQSDDGFHDWTIDTFDAATDRVQPGTPTSVTFVASEAGTFEYYCSVGNHRAQGMVGTLIVEEELPI